MCNVMGQIEKVLCLMACHKVLIAAVVLDRFPIFKTPVYVGCGAGGHAPSVRCPKNWFSRLFQISREVTVFHEKQILGSSYFFRRIVFPEFPKFLRNMRFSRKPILQIADLFSKNWFSRKTILCGLPCLSKESKSQRFPNFSEIWVLLEKGIFVRIEKVLCLLACHKVSVGAGVLQPFTIFKRPCDAGCEAGNGEGVVCI